MKPCLSALILFLTLGLHAKVQAQSDSSLNSTPTVGFGIGSIKLYGDLHDRKYGSPMTGNAAISVFLKQKLNDYLAIRFTFMSAKIRGEERSIQRNVNFETTLRSGAVYLEYNFDHFLPKNRKITPIVSAGLEAIKFNPKTDIANRDGERYNYWSDGTIRNLSENSPNAKNAVLIQRDYNYETDIREIGYNPSVTYEKRAFVIPVGVGVAIKLNDQFNFRLESMMHLSFTDYIDGVTPHSSSEFIGQKKGNANNDHYLVNSAYLSYNFQKVAPADPYDDYKKGIDRSPIDYLAIGNTEDYDGDGVIDLIDQCPNSPPNMVVDSVGCPIDSDGDGIPDYLDAEPFSINPHLTNGMGIEVTDDMLYESYLRFNDSTLKYAEVINRSFGERKKNASKYRIQIEEHRSGEAPKDIGRLLSLADMEKLEQGNNTIYTVGNYATVSQANARASEMKDLGFDKVAILEKNEEGTYVNTNRDIIPMSNTMASTISKEIVVFRVQLGAFKNKPSDGLFTGIKDLIVVEEGGLLRFMTGSFDSFESAARYKLQMVIKGYKGAFVVPYKNGNRVTLESVGVNVLDSNPLIGR